MAEETVWMTSAGWNFEDCFGSKMEEKVVSEMAGGNEVVTDIGL